MTVAEDATPQQKAALLELGNALTDFSREELLSALQQVDIHPEPQSSLPLVRSENREKIEALWEAWRHAKSFGALALARFDEDTETAISQDPEMHRLISKDKDLAKGRVSIERKKANQRAKMRLRIAIYGGRLAAFNSQQEEPASEAPQAVQLENAS